MWPPRRADPGRFEQYSGPKTVDRIAQLTQKACLDTTINSWRNELGKIKEGTEFIREGFNHICIRVRSLEQPRKS
jgi:hypothetical protein